MPKKNKTVNCKPTRASGRSAGSAARKNFARGLVWFAAWLLDNVEGDTVTEESLQQWGTEALREREKRQNDGAKGR